MLPITQATIAICFSSFAFHSVHLIHTTIRNQSFEEYADILVVNQTTTKQFGHGPSKSSSIIGDTHVTSIMPNRSFVPWREENNNPLPCIIDLQEGPDFNPLGHVISNQPSNEGLLFVKIEKAASTTISSVAARIAHALAHRVDANVTRPEDGLKVSKICKTRLSHLWSKRTEKLSKRDKDKSFLWTFLKDPTKRLLSIYFFFIIDLKKNHYSEEHLIEWLRYETARNPGGQLREIADRLHEVNLTDFSDEEIDLYIQKTIDNMNFIGLVERMNESLVLLQLMLDLHPSDVAIVASSKMAGDYMIFDADKKAGCQRLGYKRDIFPGYVFIVVCSRSIVQASLLMSHQYSSLSYYLCTLFWFYYPK
mmetsp:Transcript_19604/g.22706  ORF Transcript_19604/g.22706 Transcript_19604/m.22706 type:complete len:365 (-) Transcript_19604:779-1873(-)